MKRLFWFRLFTLGCLGMGGASWLVGLPEGAVNGDEPPAGRGVAAGCDIFPLARAGVGNDGPPLQLAVPVTEEALPADASAVIRGVEAEFSDIQKKADLEKAAIQEKADAEKKAKREKVIASLKELQDKYTREAKLDEAVAIRDRIRLLKLADEPVYKDPGTLYYFERQIGKSFLFEVTGGLDGSVWGTEVYTGDSNLAKAAVHIGALKPNQKGIVKVTIHESPAEFTGSTLNGVTSSGWSQYRFSYSIRPYAVK